MELYNSRSKCRLEDSILLVRVQLLPHLVLVREVQDLCTERLPSMTNPLWWPARPLIPRVKGREGLLKLKNLEGWQCTRYAG